tara:strand:- start:9388 stop:9591 length:204 start_codon:yes stop_codon:yes gene_type:complete
MTLGRRRRTSSILPMGGEAAFDRARLRAARRSCPRQREARRRIAGALLGAVLVLFVIVALAAAQGLA